MWNFFKELTVKHKHSLFWVLPLIVATGVLLFGSSAIPQQKESVLFITPDGGSFLKDTYIEAVVRIKAAVPINAVEALIVFPPELLEVTKILKDESVLNLWIQEAVFNNEQGTVSFIGGIPNPGFNGEGTIVKIFFKARREGWATIKYISGTMLANDGKGTNVLERTDGASYFIKAPPAATLDLNKDGKVTVGDIGLFLSLWRNPDPSRTDFNIDGKVDLIDLGILIASLGKSYR